MVDTIAQRTSMNVLPHQAHAVPTHSAWTLMVPTNVFASVAMRWMSAAHVKVQTVWVIKYVIISYQTIPGACYDVT